MKAEAHIPGDTENATTGLLYFLIFSSYSYSTLKRTPVR